MHHFFSKFKKKKYRIIDSATGLSLLERERINSYPKLTNGVADFFGKSFFFQDSDAFIHSVDEIFKQNIYKFYSENDSPYIIDCGANIGLSIYYFKKMFPNSTIVAFEPDEEIFKILEKNVANIHNNSSVEIRKEAVWIANTELEFFSEGSLAGSLVMDYSQKKNIVKINAIDLKKYLNQKIDFLKIDIEGAENTLIFDIKDLLYNVKYLFLEYHGLIGEKQNLGDILNMLSERGFQYYIRLAGDTISFPFFKAEPKNFNQQLNIFCYR
jgi:FkbM family methyltransferase